MVGCTGKRSSSRAHAKAEGDSLRESGKALRGGACVLTKAAVLTQGCRGAVGYHEARVQASFSHQEGRQLAERRVAQSFDSSLTDCRKFMDANGQIVQGLREQFSSVGWLRHVLPGSGAQSENLLWLGIHRGSFLPKSSLLDWQRPSFKTG